MSSSTSSSSNPSIPAEHVRVPHLQSTIVPPSIHYRIHETWQTLNLLRANLPHVDRQDIIQTCILLCVLMYYRVLLRREQFLEMEHDHEQV